MAWTSKYQAGFTKLIIRQICALLQRDERVALDWVGGTNVLKSVVSYQLGPLTIPQFPGILVASGDLLFDEEAVGTLHYVTTAYVAVAVSHQDQNICVELAQDYARAVDALLRTIEENLADFHSVWPLTIPCVGASNPIIGPLNTVALPSTTQIKKFFVVGTKSAARKKRTDFVMSTEFDLLIEVEET